MDLGGWVGVIALVLVLLITVFIAIIKGYASVRDLIDEKKKEMIKEVMKEVDKNEEEHMRINERIDKHSEAIVKICERQDGTNKRLKQVENGLIRAHARIDSSGKEK